MSTTIENISENILGTTSFDMKLSGMRKPQNFDVLPIGKNDTGESIIIQSDKRIGRIDLATGKGKISQSHSSGAYFHHLSLDKMTDFQLSELDTQTLRMKIFTTANKNVGNAGVTCDNSGAINVL
jgi:hypothetical protein